MARYHRPDPTRGAIYCPDCGWHGSEHQLGNRMAVRPEGLRLVIGCPRCGAGGYKTTVSQSTPRTKQRCQRR